MAPGVSFPGRASLDHDRESLGENTGSSEGRVREDKREGTYLSF